MPVQVGIPRALLYHEFGSFWETFFANSGIKFKTSAATNKQILNRGVQQAIDESCLPLKIFLGHVESLLDTCSHIFVPRITSLHRDFFMCAKFAGLPDIVKNTFSLPADRVIAPNIDSLSLTSQWQALHSACRQMEISAIKGCLAYYSAKRSWEKSHSSQKSDITGTVALIGHSYILKDPFFRQDILNILSAKKVRIITPDDIPSRELYRCAQVFQPDIYWQLSAKLAGAARLFSSQPDINGLMTLSSFGCGPDSLVNEYIEHKVLKPSNKPFITVNMDEHTGSAGLITRIEAFLDLVDWRSKR
ncbi:MAG TPA: acyl-CoA dehydratase activase-related protein [Methylomusa anaerophila]|uniref:DUF2229 domain-containing protein n=1 Tax=Methylomusa anaerophila TaxID=1930071 RepID=A0A348ANN7_9FIRM|nr:acyl-CoA dehydratase activase-related protein [Methylomusa anaerophila]BBB92685.1 hypothetical protein MAMMFC1_03380 [Methylomusa anaerophila]HML87462.1 acyl-CoA dehydratase activase-related protein [Methylomusa anaerophila]